MKNRKRMNLAPIKRFSPYLSHFKKEIAFALVSGLIAGGTTVVITAYTGKAVDTMIGKNQVLFSDLCRILTLLAMILVLSVLSQWIIQILGNKIAYVSVANLRKDAFNHLNKLPLSYYDQTSQGNIMSRFTNDLDYVSEACVAIFNTFFSGITIVIVSLFAMFWLSPLLTIVVLIMTPLIFLVSWFVTKASQAQFSKQQQLVGDISGFVSEVVGNQKIVKAFQYERSSQARFEKMNQQLLDWGQKAQFYSSLSNPTSRFIDHIAYIAIGLVGGLLALNGTGNVTVGMISSFTIYASQFSKPFIDLSGITTQLQTALAGLERIFTMMDEPIEAKDEASAIVLSKTKGNVSFEHVFFSYDPSRPLIQDLQLNVTSGQTVAIVGKTGAGKSTLVNLLMRFYDLDSGQILIDRIPIQHYTRDSLRKAFGMVLQDTWLFDGTIKENLTFGNPQATDEEVIACAKSALVHSFITKLPHGYDTVIGSQGLKISEGQRQLLTIARTMISAPPMLILDEATSSVDTLTESKIQEAFLRMMQGKTSFVIAHRLSTIRSADIILVMDAGKIVEMGNHEQLLKNPNGFYSKLYAAQFSEEN